ncbi:MAG: hydroxymethylpyrimidine/phosphomethylpyrimidine kinase, partial [Thalassolituus sp.]
MTSPVIWAVCASDSRGGAGLQAALAQAALPDENGQVCQCRSIVTAVTAQSSHGVRSVQALPVSVVEAQW